ncbi:Uncharacterised protein [Mycobacteroides abscessus subsp. massiliense]|uniref:DUF6197 family protein n=1 Tax=Mycobacteroides abscessus TaxID=36809 RepID=UPI0009A874B7|nr:hypothetical protein [Mycobacteroides abscessus]SKH53469.1 Uncharacterised protein [Mycobacteroides abscessus subsp. massiliense]SKH84205.1 Uncharacterised protein [Mycobacteroides abscessus subsp. massiliense]SKK33673.1 Uncharacterised protein [Mycobacteroides abscessus subsp. massiliense]SKK45702.1 Uncharacterised protein [Mycobacteroides abscessus subsp. massiliense]SKL87317.1 Uncharacterised protein [Mycobacteroides abscessus subsp. massiliense]
MTELTPELVAEKLREALEDLRRPINPATGNGWKKGGLGTQDSCKCLDGALLFAARRCRDIDFTQRYSLLDAMRRHVAEVIADIKGVERQDVHAPLIWVWNDDEHRVFAEVEAVLERAIGTSELPPAAQRALEAGW